MKLPIKILTADDHDLVLCGMESVFEDSNNFQIVKQCKTIAEVMEYITAENVDVIITDLHFKEHTGIELVLAIKEKYPAQKILMLTLEEHPDYIREAINAGVNGYVLKSDEKQKLLLAVDEVMRVGEYFSPAVTRILSQMPNKTQKALDEELPPVYYQLTPKEKEVLYLIAKAETNPAIMKKMNILPPTLSTHKQNLMQKIGVNNEVGLCFFAIKYGIIKIEHFG
jgi:DNA-binding NarL/FixJ family response regulator